MSETGRARDLTDDELAFRAWQWLHDLCQGKRRWTMSVPVRGDRDTDTIFAEVIRRFEKLASTDQPDDDTEEPTP